MIPHYMPTVGGGAHLYYPNQQGGGGVGDGIVELR